MSATPQLQGVCVYVDGKPVVDLWGGFADVEAGLGFGYVLNQYKTGTLQNPDLRWPTLVEAAYASLGTK